MPIIARVRILPKEVGTKPELILGDVREFKLVRYSLEPIAFGLDAIIADFSLDDGEMGTDGLENRLASSPLVGEVEVLMVSRSYRVSGAGHHRPRRG